MKLKTYTDKQLSHFPVYAYTTNINYQQEKISRPEGCPFHQIFIVKDGNGIIKSNNHIYQLSKNDLFYISENTPHEYYGTDNNFITSYLGFFSNGFDSVKDYYDVENIGVYKNKNQGNFEAVLLKIYDNINFINEISTLCSYAFSAVIAFFDEACKKEYSPIETVYNYIENNYSKMLTLDDILSFYPYSKTKLCHDFKQKYNVTIFDMITKTRLNNAHCMIKANPSMSLSTIANSCGFNNTSYFCKIYKKLYGATPKQNSF